MSTRLILVLLLTAAGALSCSAQTPAATNQPVPAPSYGEQQLDRILHDRPQLQSIVQKGTPIWAWLQAAFEPPGFQVRWENDPGDHRITGAPSISSAYPDAQNIAHLEVDGTNFEGPAVGTERSAEEVLCNLVFELNNVKGATDKRKIDDRARAGTISRNDFIIACFREEFNARQQTVEFYKTIWVPYCQAKGLVPTPSLWKAQLGTYDQELAKYPPEFWYPWHFFGDRYDRYAEHRKSGALPDPVAAFQIELPKARAGDPVAEEKVGSAYFWGYGTKQDYKSALDWYTKAVAQNNVLAAKDLAWMYGHGQGVAQDEAQTFKWCQKAADLGDAAGAEAVARRYETGKGVAADPAKALEWYKKAAARGDTYSEDWLGYAMFVGHGLPQDQKQGFAYLLAASKDNGHARYMIADSYDRGVFVSRDPLLAYKWCLLALEKDQQAFSLSQWEKRYLKPEQVDQLEKNPPTWDELAGDKPVPAGKTL